jgi:hypothetical protein
MGDDVGLKGIKKDDISVLDLSRWLGAKVSN